jgi:hypothetical protein
MAQWSKRVNKWRLLGGLMQVGDLVWYILICGNKDPVMGIITNVGSIDGYYTVEWLNGDTSIDLIDSELEVVCE